MTRRLREVLLWTGSVLGLLTIAAGLAIAFLGFHLLVFRSGSMAPEISTGSLALARTQPAAELAKGDVVSVTASTGERITHRVVSSTLRGDTASLVLRGDANATQDEEVYRVREADRVVVSVPYAGYVLAHALTPPGLVASGALALMLVLVAFTGPGRDDQVRRGPGRHVAGPAPRTSRRRARASVAVVVVVTTGLAVGSRGGTLEGTWARYTDQATVAMGSFAAAPYFTCDAATKGVATPYLYWKLDEATGSTTAADASGGRPGAYQSGGNATFGQAKACKRDTGSAVTLNGATANNYATSAYVTGQNLVSQVAPGNFTVSIWFNTNTTAGGKLIGFGNSRTGSSSNYDRHLYLTNDGRVVFGLYPGAVKTIQSATGLANGQWHHAAATLSAAGMKLYVDGDLVATDTTVTGGQTGYTGFWRVGYDNLANWNSIPTSYALAGTVDEAAVWYSALSDADVAAIARSGR